MALYGYITEFLSKCIYVYGYITGIVFYVLPALPTAKAGLRVRPKKIKVITLSFSFFNKLIWKLPKYIKRVRNSGFYTNTWRVQRKQNSKHRRFS